MKKLIIILLACFTCNFYLAAQPGFLDTKFGDSGKIIQPNAGAGNSYILKDGKILTGGFRFFPDGRLDSSYGINGMAQLKEYGLCYALQEDGKILFAGVNGKTFDGTSDVTLQRLSSDGIPDSTFGENSVIIKDFGFQETPWDIQIGPDGRITIAGDLVTNIAQEYNYPFSARFLADGTVDETYGAGGLAIWYDGLGDYMKSMILQPDGKVLLGGPHYGGGYKFYVLRYTNEGLPDESFGDKGVVITNLSGNNRTEYINALALQKDGKIIATGTGNMNQLGAYGQMATVRYNTDGSIDETFGQAGVSYVKFDNKNHAEANSVAIQPDGKMVLFGRNYNDSRDFPWDFALARLTENGIIDSAFGINGIQISDFGEYDTGEKVLIQRNGKILGIGLTQTGSEYGLVIARYNGDTINPRPTIAQIKRWIRNHILHFEDANTNAAYYVIEKSTASNGAYVPVTKITANAATNNYSYTLPETTTQSTYRIKAINKDNSITYSSPISSSDPAKAGVASFKVYPNPSKDRITVESSGMVQLRLQNSNGRVLLTQTVNGKGSMDISKLPNGIYYVVNSVNGESLKVVKE